MSRLVRKPTICICENKGADQLISAFVFAIRIVQFLFYLNPKFQASSSFLLLCRPVCVGPVRNPHCWFSHAAHIMTYHSDIVTEDIPPDLHPIIGPVLVFFLVKMFLYRLPALTHHLKDGHEQLVLIVSNKLAIAKRRTHENCTYVLSMCMRKPTIWVLTRSNTNQPVQSQNIDRGLKFWI